MYHLKEITDHAWLVLSDANQNIGLLSEHDSKLTLMVKGGTEGKMRFKDRKAVCDTFGPELFESTITVVETSKENFVKGYPVDFNNPYQVEMVGETLPLYSKTNSGAVAHCAGYYVIHFPKGPIHSYCPKYSTISKYKFEGPFKTEMEMKAVLSNIKKKIKNGYL